MEEFLKLGLELLKFGMVALVAGLGAYFGAYLKAKAQNWATHEDIDKLVEQVQAVTTATKEIEAKISSDMWDKQKQWELKRDALFEVTKRIGAVRDALFNMRIVHSVSEVENEDSNRRSILTNKQNEASEKCWEAESSFDQATLLVKLVCGDEVNRLLLKFAELMRRCAKEISREETNAVKCTFEDLRAQADAVTAAMRKEIGIDKSA